MCGITGILSLNNQIIELENLNKFSESIKHRGPDGFGCEIFDEGRIGLAHRRLSILDLSESGKQPMTRFSHLHITYNGEVYNFIELRKELEKVGFSFTSATDTEVIIASYHYWGLECFNKFNGMWAIAIYNSNTHELLLSRDRFGVKPLYYSWVKGSFLAFASETIAFKHLKGFTCQPNEFTFSLAINNPVCVEGTGYTIWKDVKQLLPGHFAIISSNSDNLIQKRWYSIPQRTNHSKYSTAQSEFFDLFADAVRLRMRSDVPVATALSGGLDSSAVFCMLNYLRKKNVEESRIDYQNIKAFVATFDGTIQDETDFAKEVVNYCNGHVEYIESNYKSLIDDIESSTILFNEISGTPISVLGNVYRSMRLSNYFVSLDGHGVDEMLYGYKSLVGMAIMQAIEEGNTDYEYDLINTYLNMFLPEQRHYERIKLDEKSKSLRKLLGYGSLIGRIKYLGKRGMRCIYGEDVEHYRFETKLGSQYLNILEVNAPDSLTNFPISLAGLSTGEKELYIDFYYRNIPYNMRDFDRASMQHGIEIRMPFMDYRLVEFIFSLPTKYKVGDGFTKRIMRDSLKDIMPSMVTQRKGKIGMGAPIHDWFNGPLNEYVKDTFSSHNFLTNNIWKGYKLRDIAIKKSKDRSWDLNTAQEFWAFLNAHIILK